MHPFVNIPIKPLLNPPVETKRWTGRILQVFFHFLHCNILTLLHSPSLFLLYFFVLIFLSLFLSLFLLSLSSTSAFAWVDDSWKEMTAPSGRLFSWSVSKMIAPASLKITAFFGDNSWSVRWMAWRRQHWEPPPDSYCPSWWMFNELALICSLVIVAVSIPVSPRRVFLLPLKPLIFSAL